MLKKVDMVWAGDGDGALTAVHIEGGRERRGGAIDRDRKGGVIITPRNEIGLLPCHRR